jgi:hypothetical protein
MALTLVVGLLLGFGRWASEQPTTFGHAARGALPVSWVLTIEYGLVVLMVAAVIHADQVDTFLASGETLTWLGGFALFTAGLFHDSDFGGYGVWGLSIKGYGTLTRFLYKPSLEYLPRLLSVWPMAWAAIVVTTAFPSIMGWARPLLRWRWILHALFLSIVTAGWIAVVAQDWGWLQNSAWLSGSVVVLLIMIFALATIRDHECKSHCMTLIASLWIATGLYPQLDRGWYVLSIGDVLDKMDYGFKTLALGDVLIIAGSLAGLCAKRDSIARR